MPLGGETIPVLCTEVNRGINTPLEVDTIYICAFESGVVVPIPTDWENKKNGIKNRK